MATRRPSQRSKPRARRSAGWSLRGRLPVFDQRDLDLIGLGLVALGIFLGFVLYGGWAGGRGGDAFARGLAFLVGQLRYGIPVALAVAGVVLLIRPMLPATRPLRTGAVCLFAALCLMLAAGTLGLGPPGARHGFWQRDFFEARGGIAGEALFYATSTLLGTLGAHIAGLFVFLAAVLLITGATVAGIISAGRSRLSGAGRRVRETTTGVTSVFARRALSLPDEQEVLEATMALPPEPLDQELVVRATHVEAPSQDTEENEFWSGEDRFPELFGRTAPATGDAGESPTPDDEEDAPEPGVAVRPAPDPSQLTPQGRLRGAVTEADDFDWRVPDPRKVLRRSSAAQARPDTAGQEKVSAQLLEALGHFGIEAKVVGMVAGPHITRYEIALAPGVKVAKVAQLKDDLAYALAAADIRILAPIPGKKAVGVEVPNANRRIVQLGDVYQGGPEDWSPLGVWLGKDVAGRAIGADLAKMPHLLVAGTTGAGKSGCVNAMLSSVLLRSTPREVRLVLVDPKQVELNHYESIPHLLTPVITSPRMAANALANLVREMEQRYGLMSLARTRSLPELNAARERRDEPPLPYILCVIDELADLMMVAPADVEDAIIRLAQKARAVGIHLVLATQSPRVDVITGMIKANVPSRIAFAVSSQTDSRVILDANGAESLLGKGDMLFSPVGTSRLQRIQGAYIDEEQIARLTDFWRRQGEPEFEEQLLEEVAELDSGEGAEDGFDPDEDPLLSDAIALVAQMGTASTSMLQRRLRLGYTRAGRLIDMLERRGVISGYEGSKPRQVLIGEGDVHRVLAALSPTAGVPTAVEDRRTGDPASTTD